MLHDVFARGHAATDFGDETGAVADLDDALAGATALYDEDRPLALHAEQRVGRHLQHGLVFAQQELDLDPIGVAETGPALGRGAQLEDDAGALLFDAECRDLGEGRGFDAGDARVTRVEPAAFTKISALGVEEQRTRVILELRSPPERWTSLGDAYRVEVEFLLREDEAVLQVPSNALFRVQGQWAVFVVQGGRARQRIVEIGDRAGLVTEIRGGVTSGEYVVQHPDDRVVEGTRLRSLGR